MKCKNLKCARDFVPRRQNQVFCSEPCRLKYYRSLPKNKETIRRWLQTPEGKESAKRGQIKYRKSAKRKAAIKRYTQSAKFRETRKKYKQSEAGKASAARYNRSKTKKATDKRFRAGPAGQKQKVKQRERYRADLEYQECVKQRSKAHRQKRNKSKLLLGLAALATQLEARSLSVPPEKSLPPT